MLIFLSQSSRVNQRCFRNNPKGGNHYFVSRRDQFWVDEILWTLRRRWLLSGPEFVAVQDPGVYEIESLQSRQSRQVRAGSGWPGSIPCVELLRAYAVLPRLKSEFSAKVLFQRILMSWEFFSRHNLHCCCNFSDSHLWFQVSSERNSTFRINSCEYRSEPVCGYASISEILQWIS